MIQRSLGEAWLGSVITIPNSCGEVSGLKDDEKKDLGVKSGGTRTREVLESHCMWQRNVATRHSLGKIPVP